MVDAGLARDLLLLGAFAFPLVLFALPGIAVYDCERLFLPCFPLWALFVGRGWNLFWLISKQVTKSTVWSAAICGVLLIQSSTPLYIMAPCHLCYYNELTSWLLGGAERAGLEIDYWGVGVTRTLITQAVELAPQESSITVTPTLHHLQADDLRRQSPILRRHDVKTIELPSDPKLRSWTLYFRRKADFPESWIEHEPSPSLATISRSGTKLACFVNLRE